jgi:hypothetical protein
MESNTSSIHTEYIYDPNQKTATHAADLHFTVTEGYKLNSSFPLWSSGQSFWLQIQGSWVRFPGLPDFLRSSGSGTGSTQPREDN